MFCCALSCAIATCGGTRTPQRIHRWVLAAALEIRDARGRKLPLSSRRAGAPSWSQRSRGCPCAGSRSRRTPGTTGSRTAPTTGALRRELVHPAGVDRAGVELAARVLAERRQAADRDRLAPHVRRRAVDHAQAPDLARAV